MNFSRLFAGNLFAEALVFVAAPIISRLYDPSAFGITSVVISTSSLFSSIACLRYERAVMLPKNDKKSKAIVFLSTSISIVIALLTALGLLVTGVFLTNSLDAPQIFVYFWFVPINILTFGLRAPLVLWFGRKQDFSMVARVRLYTSINSCMSKILAGLTFGSSAFWLLVGNTLGELGGILGLLKKWLRTDGTSRPAYAEMKSAAKEYKQFPLYSCITGLVNEVSQNIPVYVLAYYCSPAIVGSYGFAFNIVYKPVSLISMSIADVLLQKIAYQRSHGESIRNTFIKATAALGSIAIVPFTMIFIAGPFIFSIAFGEKWAVAGQYAAILSPWLFSTFIMPPANQVFTVLQKLNINFILHFLMAICRFSALIVGLRVYNDLLISLWLFSGANAIINLLYVAVAFRISSHIREGSQ